MPGFFLHVSNRLEILAEELADLLRQKAVSPFSPHIVLVQNRAIAKWVSMKIAEKNGICANVKFFLPNEFLYEIFSSSLSIPKEEILDLEFIKWKLLKLLPKYVHKEEFLKRYLEGEKRDLRLFQLSHLIAETFEKYIMFRPEMVIKWERGLGEDWQAELFRDLIKENGFHLARCAKLFIEKIEEIQEDILPDTVYAFGINYLPRFHMDILYALSNKIDLHLFLLNPCKEYWGDIIPEREIRRKGLILKEEELYIEKGNPLLSSFGKLGRDFFDLINEYPMIESERYREIEEKDLLSYIQADIFYLRDPEKIGKRKIKRDDLSVQIHVCHSAMREIEVLYDRILDMFENDPELKPKDIIVMAPDIEEYASYIQAIFNDIPFCIADRLPKHESKIIKAFLKALELKESRIKASELFEILEEEKVAKRFCISPDELSMLREWIKDVGIRWGIDEDFRKKIGLIPSSVGTWKEGLRSLILGYSMRNREKEKFQKIFPYDALEGSEAELLGRFIEFAERLFSYINEFSEKKTPSEWKNLLLSFIEDFFFIDDESFSEIQLLREAVLDIADTAERAGCFEKVDLDVIKWEIEKIIGKKSYGLSFLQKGITFCSMVPMRAVPAKVICLIGMNYDSFPRDDTRWEFDLIQKNPRKGDRSRRNDDRYLFLEAILSARKILYISYIGKSIRDNSYIPPSVVVSELMDYIEQNFFSESGDIKDQIIFYHPLHPFSSKYFKKGSRLFSYSHKNLFAAKRLLGKREERRCFIEEELSLERLDFVSIEDLCDFFSNPCKFLLKKRMNILLEIEESRIEDEEILRLKGLERYRFEKELFESISSIEKKENLISFMQKRGILPLENLGIYEFKKAEAGINLFLDRLKRYAYGEKRKIEGRIRIGEFLIEGKIEEVFSKRIFLYRYGKIRAKDRLKLWIYHLFCLCLDEDLEESVFLGLNKENRPFFLRYSPFEKRKAENFLSELLDIFKKGLKKPLHFFPESSWIYAESLKRKDASEAIKKAKEEYFGNEYRIGESSDDYYEFCFRGTDPIDEEFVELSKKVFLPIQENSNEGA